MRTKVGEPVTVRLSAERAPEHLVWRGLQWRTSDLPQLWAERDRWWEQAPGEGPASVEDYPVWRVQISPVDHDGLPVVVDVAWRNKSWLILNVFD